MNSGTPVMDGHDPDDAKPHPENPARCKACDELRHDECRQKRCACDCRKPARTKRHDWLDDQFSDEISLEEAAGHAPSKRLVQLAGLAGLVPPEAHDRAWFFLGRFKTSPQRPATNDARWSTACRRCPPGARKFKTKRLEVAHRLPTKVDWLKQPGNLFEPKDVHTEERAARSYRVGTCATCRAIYWFEMLEKT